MSNMWREKMAQATRADGWTEKEDRILAETILQFIREGSTQLLAFKAVGKVIGRTASACGFRWNHKVRKQYAEQIKVAKMYKKENQTFQKKPNTAQRHNQYIIEKDYCKVEIDYATLITYIKSLYNKTEGLEGTKSLEEELLCLKLEQEQLLLRRQKLSAKIESLLNLNL